MSNKPKHTMAPWHCHYEDIWGADETLIARIELTEDADPDLVAEANANARLIAAAPDLLEALIEAREVLAVALSWPGSESLRSKINVAIMKTESAQRVPERRHVGDYELYDRGCPDCP